MWTQALMLMALLFHIRYNGNNFKAFLIVLSIVLPVEIGILGMLQYWRCLDVKKDSVHHH